jgi:hypothetical protein
MTNKNAHNSPHDKEPISPFIKEENDWKMFTGLTTAGILIANIIFAFFANQQLNAMKDQLNTFNSQVNEMKEQSKTFKEELLVIKEENRAWIGVIDESISDIKKGEKIDVVIRIQNSGKSPALEVQPILRTEFRTEPVPIPMPIPDTSNLEKSITAIAPNGYKDLRRMSDKVFPEEGMPLFDQDIVRFYIYGQITYEDTLQRIHHTYFCFYRRRGINLLIDCANNNTMD